jgi:hypothetical protein
MSLMNVYKATDLAVDEVKFQSWKIKEGSKLSVGSVVLTYEYTNPLDGKNSKFPLWRALQFQASSFVIYLKEPSKPRSSNRK